MKTASEDAPESDPGTHDHGQAQDGDQARSTAPLPFVQPVSARKGPDQGQLLTGPVRHSEPAGPQTPFVWVAKDEDAETPEEAEARLKALAAKARLQIRARLHGPGSSES